MQPMIEISCVRADGFIYKRYSCCADMEFAVMDFTNEVCSSCRKHLECGGATRDNARYVEF